uniref:Uncharacterized protein n=1 Tax=Arundo donax TaxID=35708 RepID=A0A0A9G1L0_ARUDO
MTTKTQRQIGFVTSKVRWFRNMPSN